MSALHVIFCPKPKTYACLFKGHSSEVLMFRRGKTDFTMGIVIHPLSYIPEVFRDR